MQVAEALDHAHEHGVIHRDVKPSNVILDNDGKPWVTDFGLARIETDATLTVSGDLLGTVRYMSPEQALAKRIVVDHRTDVYSLGATLYELLTLQPVFGGQDRQELLRQIAFEEPKSPQKLNKAIPAELEIIVTKAMAKNPAERYDTAQELADDLKRFLEDRPIRARRPTLVQRAAKWSRRHKPIVWSAAVSTFLLLVIGLVGLGIGHTLITKERDAAAASAEEADRQRQRTEENFRASRAAVDRVFTRAAEELANVPHMTEVRRALLEDTTEFYERFVQLKPESPEIRQEIAHAYRRLGHAYHELGRIEDAAAVARKRVAISEGLHAEFPDRIDFKRSLQDSYLLLRDWGRKDEEKRSCANKALKLAEQLVRQEPKLFVTRLNYIYCQSSLFQLQCNKKAENERHARRAITLLEQLRVDFPDHQNLDLLEAHERHWIGAYFQAIGKLDEAESLYRQSLSLYSAAFEKAPHKGWWASCFIRLQRYLAKLLLRRGELAEAQKILLPAVTSCQSLVNDYPDNPHYPHQLSIVHSIHAQILIAQKHFEEAEKTLLRVSELLRLRPLADLPHKYDVGWHHFSLGLVQNHLGKVGPAADSFREALTRYESGPAKDCLRWALVTCPLPQFRDAERSIAYSKEFLQQEPESAVYWNSLGIGHYRAGQFYEALEALSRSVELGGDDDISNYYIISDYYFLAMAHWRRGERGEAHQWYQRAVAKQKDAARGFQGFDLELGNLQLGNFRREAEKLLGISAEEPSESASTDAAPTEDQPLDVKLPETEPTTTETSEQSPESN